MSEIQRVKDGSQPYKLALGLVVVLLLGLIVVLLSGNKGIGGISFDNPQYGSATNTFVSCSGATSTVLLAANVGRTSFELTASSTTDTTLCKSAAGCVINSGLILATGDYWSQNDGYTGAYSCIGDGATSTLHIIFSN